MTTERTSFRVRDHKILNGRDEIFFEMGQSGGLSITGMGLQALCGVLNGPGFSEQGEPLYGSNLDELRVRIASLYDEIRSLRDENTGLKRQLERGRRTGRLWP